MTYKKRIVHKIWKHQLPCPIIKYFISFTWAGYIPRSTSQTFLAKSMEKSFKTPPNKKAKRETNKRYSDQNMKNKLCSKCENIPTPCFVIKHLISLISSTYILGAHRRFFSLKIWKILTRHQSNTVFCVTLPKFFKKTHPCDLLKTIRPTLQSPKILAIEGVSADAGYCGIARETPP